ncbi:MAG: hypothetical protein NC930_06105, partial [Candidatus Omnitrophica bacterium]|nr:hypothetical protein [Candidatus Omnitrophota bacterium]
KNPDGFKNGFVVSLERATHSLEELIDALLPTFHSRDISAYVVLGNSKLGCYRFSSSQYYHGVRRTISSYEIRNVVEQTRSVATLPLSESILQTVPETFLVNDIPDIRNPLGLEAHRLGVNLNIFTMEFEYFRNISKAFEAGDIEVKGYFPKTLVISEAVLTPEEREAGALVIDIADDIVQLILWKNGRLVTSKAVALGGMCLTQQVAEAWHIEMHDAEKVKEKFATLERHSEFGEELIPLIDRNGKTSQPVHRQTFQNKFLEQAKNWLTDLLVQTDQLAREEKVLHPHLVFTGGGAALDGFLEFLQEEFSRDGRIGITRQVEAPNEILVDPSLAGALGMYCWLATRERERQQLFAPRGILQKSFDAVRRWFATYF